MILVRLVMESHVSSIVSQVVCFHWPKDTQLTLRWSTIHDDCWAQPIRFWIFSSSGKTRPRTVLFTQNIIGQNRSYHNKAHISSVFFSFLNVSIHTHYVFLWQTDIPRSYISYCISQRSCITPTWRLSICFHWWIPANNDRPNLEDCPKAGRLLVPTPMT